MLFEPLWQQPIRLIHIPVHRGAQNRSRASGAGGVPILRHSRGGHCATCAKPLMQLLVLIAMETPARCDSRRDYGFRCAMIKLQGGSARWTRAYRHHIARGTSISGRAGWHTRRTNRCTRYPPLVDPRSAHRKALSRCKNPPSATGVAGTPFSSALRQTHAARSSEFTVVSQGNAAFDFHRRCVGAS